jgi:hypothetical protein
MAGKLPIPADARFDLNQAGVPSGDGNRLRYPESECRIVEYLPAILRRVHFHDAHSMENPAVNAVASD